MGRWSRLLLTIFERTGIAGRQEPPCLLRLGDGPPAARVRYRSRTSKRYHYICVISFLAGILFGFTVVAMSCFLMIVGFRYLLQAFEVFCSDFM